RSWEVVPLLSMRIWRVPARDALDRRLEMVEAALLHDGGQLRTEAASPGRLVDDDAAARLLHRCDDGLGVERQQGSEIDDLGIDPVLLGGGLGHVHHRTVGEHGDTATRPPDHRSAERHRVIALWHLAQRMLRPRYDGTVVVAVE